MVDGGILDYLPWIGVVSSVFGVYFGFKYLTRFLRVGKIKHYLKMCIQVLGSDLKNSLIVNDLNLFNTLLSQYLSKTDDSILTKLAKIISTKYPVNKFSDLTNPANVMRSLIKAISGEQLNQNYNNGYLLPPMTLEEFKEKAPFVYNYCFIAFTPTKTYVDFIRGHVFASIPTSVKAASSDFLENAAKQLEIDYKDIHVPKKVIYMAYKQALKYYIKLENLNYENMMMRNGERYMLHGLILKGGALFTGFNPFGGDGFNVDDKKNINASYQFCFEDFLAVAVFRQIESK